jgi:hypothetical protein
VVVVGIKILRCAVWKLMLKVVRRKEEEEEEEMWERSWFCKTQAATVATTLLLVVRQWRALGRQEEIDSGSRLSQRWTQLVYVQG